jgi:hypothetical protein
MTTYNARGIHFFSGRITCPLAGVGSRGDTESNRLVLDDADSKVTIDQQAGTITVENDRTYPDKKAKKTIADLMFLAEGFAADGSRHPFSIHLKIQKMGKKLTLDLHRHLRNAVPIVRADYEPFVVTVIDGGTSTVVLDRARTDKLISEPSLALRIVKAFMAMSDHLDGVKQDPSKPGYRIADLSVGFGALGLNYMMARAQLVSLETSNQPLIERGDVPAMLRDGAWEMRLTALSEKWLPEVVQRDLFLYGLDEVPLLREVRERGLRKGQTLAFRLRKDGGELALDGKTCPLPGAHDVARAYIEFHMLGGLLAEAAERRAQPRA